MQYLIAASPRTGSNLLCSLFMHTGRLGEPREYFCPSEFGPFAERIARDPSAFGAYYANCRERFTKGGVFGVKAHFHQLADAAAAGFDIERDLPRRVLYVERSDKIGQAISYARALQTGAWISAKEERAAPRFDPDSITKLVHLAKEHERSWEALFAEHGIEPYRLGYESLCADFEGELQRVLPFLGLDPTGVDTARAVQVATGSMRKQRDGLSDEWRARYVEWLRDRANAAEVPAALPSSGETLADRLARAVQEIRATHA